MREKAYYQKILEEELVLAMGCTEPIAIAYASAYAKSVLGMEVERLVVECSGNVIKNVMGVTIPNTGNLKGIKAAAVAGVVFGDHEKNLEVIAKVEPNQIIEVQEKEKGDFCQVSCLHGVANLNIIVTAYNQEHYGKVQIMHTHLNVVLVEKDHQVLVNKLVDEKDFNSVLTDRSFLNVRDIYDFSSTCDLSGIDDLIRIQIKNNYEIAKRGLNQPYGVNVGKTILQMFQNPYMECIAYGAAGSDARMSGCSMGVVTNSGSGNQGLTTSVPLIHYCALNHIEEEKLIRALILSNLLTIHIKTQIGRLSAFCGVVCAASGCFAGFAYLENQKYEVIEKMIINHLGNVSGIICDGAKESCASKITSSLFSAMIGFEMAKNDECLPNGCGLVKENVEETIKNVGYVGREGMKETDVVVLEVMTQASC